VAKVIWSEPALAQLESIVDFIALDKPDAARAVAARVFAATDQLESLIRLGRPIREFDHKNYRQVWINPCWLHYRANEESVYILHVRRAERPLKIGDLLFDDK
jgi:toxin ParE1/3/4